MLSRLQLDTEVLERLGQKSASVSAPVELPDFAFYTGCNVLKTPHIALLALDIMDALSLNYQVMDRPSHCCGRVGEAGGGQQEWNAASRQPFSAVRAGAEADHRDAIDPTRASFDLDQHPEVGRSVSVRLNHQAMSASGASQEEDDSNDRIPEKPEMNTDQSAAAISAVGLTTPAEA